MEEDSKLTNSTNSLLNFIKDKPLIFLALFLFVVAVFLSFFLSSSKNYGKKELVNTTPTISAQYGSDTTKKDTVINNAPRVYFKEYENKSDGNIFPFLKKENFSSYVLKSNFTSEEALSFARKLGLNEIKSSNKFHIVYNFTDKESKGLLELNKSTGSFVFQSYGILKPASFTKSQSKIDETIAFLKETDLYDDTISCENTYEKKSDLWKVTYVECHRDWEKTGIPIVNLGGVLNIEENKKISELKVGDVDSFGPLNDLITNVKKVTENNALTDNSEDNNRARPNDFNTITLGITDDGRILTIESNLRWLKEAKSINKNNDLITLDEAVSLFKSNKYKFALTVPSGEGVLDFNKVYPDNKAISQKAIIDEILMVYLDKNVNNLQEDYEPYYLFRGMATLESGYSVKFVEIIPALKSKQAATNLLNKEVAGDKIYIAQRRKLQIDYFDPSETPTPIPSPTRTIGITVVPTIVHGVPNRYPCVEMIDKAGATIYERTVNVPGYGNLTIVAFGGHHTFYFKSTTAKEQSIAAINKAFFTGPVAEQYVISVSKYINRNERVFGIQLNTLEDVYKLFDKMNESSSPVGGDGRIKQDPYPAPVTLDISDPTDPLFMLNKEMMTLVAGNVAKKILELKRQDQISLYAVKEDIFIPETLFGFEGVFFQASGDYERQWKRGLCYISGGSPVIYLYPTQKTKVSVKTAAPVIYTDPSINVSTWNVIASPDGTVELNGIERKNLYYEYDKSKISFGEPSAGFIIDTSAWKEFVKNNLSNKLGLNLKETESLITEINNALFNVKKTKYLKFSLISQTELNQKLPLTINPVPDNFYRINVFIKPVNEKANISEPQITLLRREGFTVLEIGAYLR